MTGEGEARVHGNPHGLSEEEEGLPCFLFACV